MTLRDFETKDIIAELQHRMKYDTFELNYNFKEITNIVCDYFNTTSDAARSESKKGIVVDARFFSMYFIKLIQQPTYFTDLGRYFGDRDHTTALNARFVVLERLFYDSKAYQIYHRELCGIFGIDYTLDLISAKKEYKIRSRFNKKRKMPAAPLADTRLKDEKKVALLRPTATYTNTNWEQQLEEKVKALAI